MQIAAANAVVLAREDFPQEQLEKELEIYKTQALNEGKPENIVERFAEGKLEKYLKESVLLEQSYIKDPNMTVKDLLTEIIAKTGENIQIKRFARFQIGE
jgi:elongation factor Ts